VTSITLKRIAVGNWNAGKFPLPAREYSCLIDQLFTVGTIPFEVTLLLDVSNKLGDVLLVIVHDRYSFPNNVHFVRVNSPACSHSRRSST
jgi:hypothetical protein